MIRDEWQKVALARVSVHMMRAATKGRDYAPDQTPELSKSGQVGPKSAVIARILRQHAELWAEDARTSVAAGVDFDSDATWRACIAAADAEIGRFLAGHTSGRAA